MSTLKSFWVFLFSGFFFNFYQYLSCHLWEYAELCFCSLFSKGSSNLNNIVSRFTYSFKIVSFLSFFDLKICSSIIF